MNSIIVVKKTGMDGSITDIILVALIAAALVFGHTLTLYGADVANEKRDKIISGIDASIPLTLEHRWLMLMTGCQSSSHWLVIRP